jgi:hypothetical protein
LVPAFVGRRSSRPITTTCRSNATVGVSSRSTGRARCRPNSGMLECCQGRWAAPASTWKDEGTKGRCARVRMAPVDAFEQPSGERCPRIRQQPQRRLDDLCSVPFSRLLERGLVVARRPWRGPIGATHEQEISTLDTV